MDFVFAVGDAAEDADADGVFVAGGLGFEVTADGVELLVGGDDALVLAGGHHEEPVAELSGADGERAARGADGDVDEGAAVGGGEGDGAVGDAEELVEGDAFWHRTSLGPM